MISLLVSLITERPREFRVIGRDAIRLLLEIQKLSEIQPVWKLVKTAGGEPNAATMMASMLQTPTPAVYLKSR